MTPSGPRWTGRVELIPSQLDLPLRWRKPRRVFVDSMSDLFHEKLPDEDIDRVFAVMGFARQHTFQVLTKRATRMQAYLTRLARSVQPLEHAARELGRTFKFMGLDGEEYGLLPFPVPNVWLGVSVEDQATADERIPHLLATPAAVRFVSYEPALSGVDFSPWLDYRTHRKCEHCHAIGPDGSTCQSCGRTGFAFPALDMIIVGGESGPRARPFDVAWCRSVIAQCRAAEQCGRRPVVFVKQLGAWPVTMLDGDMEQGRLEATGRPDGTPWDLPLFDRKGGDPAEWPEDLRVREMPRAIPKADA